MLVTPCESALSIRFSKYAARAGIAGLSDPLTEALGRLELASLSPQIDPGLRVQLSQAAAPLDHVLQRTRELTERLDSGT